jgi:hypothetical protein
MRNYVLQKDPCNFLKLCISPWEVPFSILLYFFSPWRLFLFFFPPTVPISGCFFPPSLCSLRSAWSRGVRRQAPARGSGARLGRRACGCGGSTQERRARPRRWPKRGRSGAARRARAAGAGAGAWAASGWRRRAAGAEAGRAGSVGA